MFANLASTQELRTVPGLSQRLDWPDAVRGVGIVLVVYGHAARGVNLAGLFDDEQIFKTTDYLIYMFHMPLFFIVSGFLFHPPTNTDVKLLLNRILKLGERLIYPLVLWTYIYLFAKLLFSGSVNQAIALADIGLPLPPVDHFWFLWALFLIQLVSVATSMALGGWLGLLALVSIAALGAAVGPGGAYLGNAVYYAPFFVLGLLLSRVPILLRAETLAIAGMAIFVATEVLAVTQGLLGAPKQVLAMIAALSFVMMVAGYVTLWPGSMLLRLAVFLGRESMAIFLAHVFFSAAVRIGLLMAGVEDTVVHLVLGTVAGIIGPLALCVVARHVGVSRLLGF